MNIAIVLSGGVGSRMKLKIPKQYFCINNRMLITYSLETILLHPTIDAVVIVAEKEWCESIIKDVEENVEDTGKEIVFAKPGQTRQFSVLNGLNRAKELWGESPEKVLIHDAARPNLKPQMIRACMSELEMHDGVMPVLAMKDTVYLSADGKRISGLLDRKTVFAGQAPEGFVFRKYLEANMSLLPERLLAINGSSEPAIMAGLDVVVIEGDENNYKITTEEDLKRFIGEVVTE